MEKHNEFEVQLIRLLTQELTNTNKLMESMELEFEEVHLKDKQCLKAGVLLDKTMAVVCSFTYLENATITSGSSLLHVPVRLCNHYNGTSMYVLTHACVLYVCPSQSKMAIYCTHDHHLSGRLLSLLYQIALSTEI